MTRLPLLVLLLLPACASNADGEWPSLARRPGEITAAEEAAEPAATTAQATPATQATPSTIATAAAARIADAARELQEVETRWQRQRTATQAAVGAAGNAARNSSPWATAQLELTRLERVGAEAADLRDRLDAVAGDLAVAAAGGNDVAGPLRQAGEVIGRIDTLRSQHLQLFESAQRSIAR
jgi:hypothetical protein